jgi:hypothetical protein
MLDPKRVAHRAVALSAVVCRTYLEEGASDPEAETLHAGILKWAISLGIVQSLEPKEVAILMAPLGQLTHRQRAEGMWVTERLGVLAWSLNLVELPVHDQPFDPRFVSSAVGFLREDALERLETATLRSGDEINDAAGCTSAVAHRLHSFARERTITDFAAMARTVAYPPPRVEAVPLVAGDLRIGDAGLLDAPELDWQKVFCMSVERMKGLTWVCGETLSPVAQA